MLEANILDRSLKSLWKWTMLEHQRCFVDAAT